MTARTVDVAKALLADGWRPTVIATTAAEAWLDREAIERLLGEPPRVDFRSPEQPKRGGPPAAVVVCPATFNTVNRTAAGINDSYALGVLCEAIGSRVPTLLVPMVNNKLWGHPAWSRSLRELVDAGVELVDIHTGESGASPVVSGSGGDVVARFDPGWLATRLMRMREGGL